MNKLQRARKIIDLYYKQGKGNNFSKEGELLEFKEGYIYSLKDYQITIKPKNLKELETALIKQLETLYKLMKNKKVSLFFIGLWENEGTLYIDINTKTNSKSEALMMGKLNEQLAIWDIKNKKEIYINSKELEKI
jgi:hypothetical protein